MAIRRSLPTQTIASICHLLVPISQFPAKTEQTRHHIASADQSQSQSPNPNPNFIQRLFHRRSLYQSSSLLPDLFPLPAADTLREKLHRINDRISFNGLVPPPPPEADARISVEHARRLLRAAQVEKVKLALSKVGSSAVSYAEYLQLCVEECGDENLGLEISKAMDLAGNVIVLGNTVFLRPHQVARAMEALIEPWISLPDDPRRAKLERMEAEVAEIDEKARGLARAEMYCGLGYVILQTLGFMRLTFWELSWDVMEPICFFVTSLHFVAAYGFFLRTATEPSFEGLFRRRFEVRRRRLMAARGFDFGKYEELRKAVNG